MNLNEPTSDECTNYRKVFENDGRIGYACWYPQMGGYWGKAIAVFDKEWISYDHGCTEGGCIDVYIWHNGEFPFDGKGGNQPRVLHHCSPEQFIELGIFFKKINDKNMIKKVMESPNN